jgi:hypothetical protein
MTAVQNEPTLRLYPMRSFKSRNRWISGLYFAAADCDPRRP